MVYTGVSGDRTAEELKLLPVVETTWRYWKQLYPGTKVVTGNNNYTFYPYGEYREPNTAPFGPVFPDPQDNPTIDLYGPKAMTLGVRFGQIAKAYPFPNLGQEAVINDSVDLNPIVVAFYAREQFAVPYSRVVDGQTLTFEKTTSSDPVYPFMLKDAETGTQWNLKGEAVSGSLIGKTLTQVPAHNAFWFAWATFWQHTGVH
jgi:hypothetical protein